MSRVDKRKKKENKEKVEKIQKENVKKEEVVKEIPKKEITKEIPKIKENKEKLNKSLLKTFLKIIVFLFIFVFATFYYMRFIETKMLFVKEVKIENSLIPNSLSGIKIVHFSDLHYGITTDEKMLDKLVRKIQVIRPDILVFTGDLLDERKSYQTEDYHNLTNALSKMEASISKYYIKGNQDYSNEQVDTIFEEAGFISLNNRSDIIYGSSNEKIQFVGMGSFLRNDFHQEESFEKIEEGLYTITLFHEPDNIMELQNRTIHLALAGHSHNNQNGIPYLRNLFTKKGAKTYYDTYYKVHNTEFFINPGIGTGSNKLRLMAPPTIHLYRLVNK